MEKEMIILTKSEKYNNYCVAGIDVETGEWIRLVSDDEEIKYALTSKDIEYDDGEEVQILDKVKVKIKDNQECWYHPENYIIDNEHSIEYIEKSNEDDIEDYVTCKEHIFFDAENSITEEDLKDQDDIYSLTMIEPDVFKVRTHDKNPNKKRLKASILYNEDWYNNIIITDLEFIEKYYDEVKNSEDGSKNFKDTKVVLSLAEKNPTDDKYYKLVASVIE